MLEKFKQLKLSDYPIAEIDSLMTKIGPLAILLTDFHNHKEIERAVNNTKEEPEFNSVSRISFKPEKYNRNYLRASTPNNTMFYGSVISETDNDDEIKNSRIVGATEVSTLMRNSEVIEGWSRITFGKWKVKEQISLATIIDPTKDYDKPYLNELKNKYNKYLNEVPNEVKENTIKWLQYFAQEFEKSVSNGNNHDYLISAKFTEIFVNTSKYDGVIYPSVQSKGYGLCVAIHPRAIHKLELIKVLQCKITKTLQQDNENHFLLTNEKNCIVEKNSEIFKLLEIQ
ncbi:TPA: hypothetical protein ACT5CJ_002319 [Flavobacterium psychrophilum]